MSEGSPVVSTLFLLPKAQFLSLGNLDPTSYVAKGKKNMYRLLGKHTSLFLWDKWPGVQLLSCDSCIFSQKLPKRKWKSLSLVCLFTVLWTVTSQAPLSMEFSRQGYWSGLPFPSLGDLPNPGIKHRSAVLKADSLPFEPPRKPRNCQTAFQRGLYYFIFSPAM